jgi:hypothetical protein
LAEEVSLRQSSGSLHVATWFVKLDMLWISLGLLLIASAQCFVILTLEVNVQVSGFRHFKCERESLQEFELHSDMDISGSDMVSSGSDMDFSGSGNFFVSGLYNIFDEVAIREHFQNLCAKIGVDCKEHFARAQTATETRNWAVAYSEWTSCRNIIERSEDLLDKDEGLWLESCQKLVSARLWAFHSKKFERALDAAIDAWEIWNQLKNAPESLDLHPIFTMLMMIYLWASSDCEEETLDPDVKSYLVRLLSYQKDGVPDSEVRTLKQQCKQFVLNEWEFVFWEVQKQFFYYFEREECLRWAREGSKIYENKYSNKLDYVSKLYEAATLFMAGACEDVIEVCEQIREKLQLVCSQISDTNIYPAAQYCTVEYAFMINQMLYICYWTRMLGPGQSTSVMIERQAKLGEEYQLLLSQIYSDVKRLWPLKICLVEALEYAENNRYEIDVYHVYS